MEEQVVAGAVEITVLWVGARAGAVALEGNILALSLHSIDFRSGVERIMVS